MWKSLMNAVVEALAMSDPVAYMYYLNAKRETALQAEVTSYREPSRQPALRPIDGALHAGQEVSA